MERSKEFEAVERGVSQRSSSLLALFLLLICLTAPTQLLAAAPTFSEFAATVPQRPDGVFVVDGDLPIRDENELYNYYLANFGLTSTGTTIKPNYWGVFDQPSSLIQPQLAIAYNGGDVKWNDSQKLSLTYCVSTSFNNPRFAGGIGQYYVTSAMLTAAEGWQGAAYVNYTHVASQDTNCANSTSVMFRVLPYIPVGLFDPLEASSFYPDYPASQRNLYVNVNAIPTPSAGLTLSGLLRHELGHTLGFVHEHIRPEANAPLCRENAVYRALTTYDVYSVMHYRSGCNGVPGDYYLTTLDKTGVRSVYGTRPAPPAPPPPAPPPPNQKPIANLGGPLVYALINEPIVFDGTGSYDPEGKPLTYHWSFGDGSVANSGVPVIEHKYTRAGTYQLTFSVDDGVQYSSLMYNTVIIKDLAWLTPIIDLTINE
jgi:hypothetical protein